MCHLLGGSDLLTRWPSGQGRWTWIRNEALSQEVVGSIPQSIGVGRLSHPRRRLQRAFPSELVQFRRLFYQCPRSVNIDTLIKFIYLFFITILWFILPKFRLCINRYALMDSERSSWAQSQGATSAVLARSRMHDETDDLIWVTCKANLDSATLTYACNLLTSSITTRIASCKSTSQLPQDSCMQLEKSCMIFKHVSSTLRQSRASHDLSKLHATVVSQSCAVWVGL